MEKQRKMQILLKLAEIAKDPQGEKRIGEAAERLFPKLESLLPETEIESLAIDYGDANRRSGFVDGFNAAVLLLAGNPSLLLNRTWQ